MHGRAMDSTPSYPRSLLACLGDASRFQLVRSLIEAERCVTELARQVGLSQSCTTRHLQVLAREGLVRGEREGKRVVFRLRREEPSVSALLEWAVRSADGSGAFPFPAMTPKLAAKLGVTKRSVDRTARPRRVAAPEGRARTSGGPPAGSSQVTPYSDVPGSSDEDAPHADRLPPTHVEQPRKDLHEESADQPAVVYVRRPDLEDYLL